MARLRRTGRELSTWMLALASVAIVPLAAMASDDVRHVTLHPADDIYPAWSPDGTRIAFNSFRSGFDIWVVRLPGGAAGMYNAVEPDGSFGRLAFDTAVRITDGAGPAWSPDNQQIAFERNGNIWVKAAQPGGWGATQLTFAASDVAPAWSPDGSQIAFSSKRPPGNVNNYHIWVIPAAGGAATQLTFGTDIATRPAWSPDGSQIAFDSLNPINGIWVVAASGGAAVQLTSWGAVPAWSPDGSRIAFASQGDLWVMPSTGGTATQLTFDPFFDTWPRWSPDGSQITFWSDRRGNHDICVIDVEPAVSGHPQVSTAPESWGSIKGRYRE